MIVDMPAVLMSLSVASMQVYANDLNPKSFQYLCENIKLNKVKPWLPLLDFCCHDSCPLQMMRATCTDSCLVLFRVQLAYILWLNLLL